jgi:hypothetical protein
MLLPSLLVLALAFQDTAVSTTDIPRGLRKSEPGATAGYVLFAPILSRTTFLMDSRGETVHTWEGKDAAIQVARLPRDALVEISVIAGR